MFSKLNRLPQLAFKLPTHFTPIFSQSLFSTTTTPSISTPPPTTPTQSRSLSTTAQAQEQAQTTTDTDHLLEPAHTIDIPNHHGHEEVGARHQPFFDVQDNTDTKEFLRSSLHPEVIVPQFWYGENSKYNTQMIDPNRYTIDLSNYKQGDVSADNHNLVEEMDIKFNDTGLIVLKNTGLTELSQMRRMMEVIIPKDSDMAYEGGSNWRNYIDSANVYDTGAPHNAWIHYHHEMAYVQYSPLMLGFACAAGTKDARKGATFVSDQVLVTDALLKTELGQKLKDKGICYHRNLTDRQFFLDNKLTEFEVYNHWQQSFDCETMDQAQYNAEQRGLQVEWDLNHPKWGRYMKTKFFVDTFEYCPDTDSNLLYASVADHHMWFDSWPGVSRLAPEDRPLKITFGDLTEFSDDELRLFVDVYDRYGVPIDWEIGDVAVLCNYRWAHGRPPIYLDNENGEKRELGVVLGPMFKRMGQREDKWDKPATL